ncbi:MAG: hypothetical protein ACI8T1_000657 [Verrucomicrobiales bacterium]|jgi:hypothetical protein
MISMHSSRLSSRGFTLPELLVAGAMSAAFFVAAAISYQAITYNRGHYQALVSVTVDPAGDLSGALGNFYANLSGQTILNAYGAPSYGRAAAANQVYDRFWDDMEKASAVFCLSRNGKLNTIRPVSLTFPVGTISQEIDSNSAFLQMIIGTPGASIYTDFRNVSPMPGAADPGHLGGSVYVLQPYDVADQLGVRALYEIDFVEVSSPAGVYASVRRYVDSDLSDYYDVFYSEASVSDFGPLFVAFEKSSRLAYPETTPDAYGVTLDSYKVGPRAPFFMMWWPDPAFILGKDGKDLDLDGAALPTGDVRKAYYTMCAKTGIMGVVPNFPPL